MGSLLQGPLLWLSSEGGRRHRKVTAGRAPPVLTCSDRLGCHPRLGTLALVPTLGAVVGVGSQPCSCMAWGGWLKGLGRPFSSL